MERVGEQLPKVTWVSFPRGIGEKRQKGQEFNAQS